MSTNAAGSGQHVPGGVTLEKPGSPAIFWIMITQAAAGTLTFNILHYWNHLPADGAAVFAGYLPPVMSALAGHALKYLDENWERIIVFGAIIGAMIVSAFGTSQVLKSADGIAVSMLYSFVLDTLDLVALWCLAKHYARVAAYKRAQAGLLAAGEVLRDGSTPSPAPASGATVPGGLATLDRPPVPVVPGTDAVVPGTSLASREAVPAETAPAAVAGSGNHSAAASGTATAGPAAAEGPVKEREKGSIGHRRAGPGESEDRTAVVDEMARRDLPPLMEVDDKRRHAADLVEEFRSRTGARMSNQELAKALRMRKADVRYIRPDAERRVA